MENVRQVEKMFADKVDEFRKKGTQNLWNM